ncbi:MAG: neutral zinc metallopeptidase [Chloroflexota bacterium]
MASRFLALVLAAVLCSVPFQKPDVEAAQQRLYGLVAEPNCSNAMPHCLTGVATTSVDLVLMSRVTTSIDEYWQQTFSARRRVYTSPTIVWYTGAEDPVSTGCGVATGVPAFYCARDRTIYLDSSLLAQAPLLDGDIAVAVSIAHEWSHHVQGLLGMKRSLAPRQSSDFFPEYLELQADCGAGAWAWSMNNSHQTDAWDAPQAIHFFGSIGDASSTSYAVDAHGTDPQRITAFETGLNGGGATADCKLPLK